MENDDFINEKDLKGHHNPITADKLKIILEQIEKCIFDIKCKIEGHGTGFFCRIPYENPNKEFGNKDIYIIGNVRKFTNGKIKTIDVNGIKIRHLYSTNPGMSGSPIINLNNYKVIGMHKGSYLNEEIQWNLGIFLKEPLKLFYNLKNINSEINNNIIKIEKIKEKIKNDIKENVKEDTIENIKDDKKEDKNINLNDNKEKNEIKNEVIDEIIIQHKIENEPRLGNIQIFGYEFVKNNMDKCKMIINGNEGPLVALYNLKKPQDLNSIIEIKLKGIKQITNMHGMFDYCQRLSSLPDISKWDTKTLLI